MAGAAAAQQMSEQQILAINHLIDLKMATLSEGQVQQTVNLFKEADATLGLKFVEMDGKFEQMKQEVIKVDELRARGEASMKSQEEYIRGEFLKAHKLADDMEKIETRLAELNTGIIDQTRRTQEELNNLLATNRASIGDLRMSVQQEFLKVRGEID